MVNSMSAEDSEMHENSVEIDRGQIPRFGLERSAGVDGAGGGLASG